MFTNLSQRSQSLRGRRYRPQLELLEDRTTPAIFEVNTLSDLVNPNDGVLSLREAILAANANPNLDGERDRIVFNIPGGGVIAPPPFGSPIFRTIRLTSPLPAITEAVEIDGYSQPDSEANSDEFGINTVLTIELNGSDGGFGNGLELNSEGSSVRGLAINGILRDPNNPNRAESGNGIVIRGDGNTVAGNFLGVALSGLLGSVQEGAGVYVSDSFNNTIGGLLPEDRNLIAFNQGPGVAIDGGNGNTILKNSIHSNGGLGIDLDDDGVTDNDAHDFDVGSNGLQNFPVLTSVTRTDTETIIRGTFSSNPGRVREGNLPFDTTSGYRIDFFASEDRDPTDFGEGRIWLGSVNMTTDITGEVRDLLGNPGFVVTLPALPEGDQFITATATLLANLPTPLTPGLPRDTSEFSSAVQALPPSSDLSVTVVDLTDPVSPENAIPYEIRIRNNGPDAAINAGLLTNIPTNTTLLAFTPPPGWLADSPGPGILTAVLPEMAAGEEAIFTLVVRVNADTADGTVIRLPTSVTSDTPDPVIDNNQVSVRTTVTAAVRVEATPAPPPSPPSVPEALSIVTFTTQTGHRLNLDALSRPRTPETFGIPPHTLPVMAVHDFGGTLQATADFSEGNSILFRQENGSYVRGVQFVTGTMNLTFRVPTTLASRVELRATGRSRLFNAAHVGLRIWIDGAELYHVVRGGIVGEVGVTDVNWTFLRTLRLSSGVHTLRVEIYYNSTRGTWKNLAPHTFTLRLVSPFSDDAIEGADGRTLRAAVGLLGEKKSKTLVVTGTQLAEFIQVRQAPIKGALEVLVDGISLGVFAGIKRLRIDPLGGDDLVRVQLPASVAAAVRGKVEGTLGNNLIQVFMPYATLSRQLTTRLGKN